MTPTSQQQKNHFFLYDAELLPTAQVEIFDPRHHRQQRTIQGEALGRGATYFVRVDDHACVLRHYQRGGLVAKILHDQYFWTGIEQTRAWREWHLLKELSDRGLPVPHPVAAHVVKSGVYYRADLMTLRLNASKPLTDFLRKKELPAAQWRNVGRTVRAFHNAGVYHADLNAHNVMLTDDGEVHLIDFDKGQIRPVAPGWQQANIDRFQRSLQKLSAQISPFHYSATVWQHFLQGYNQ
ncbi:3-deoxy-D-manno-octulosonic acid kinase [Kaarinaea lacus]